MEGASFNPRACGRAVIASTDLRHTGRTWNTSELIAALLCVGVLSRVGGPRSLRVTGYIDVYVRVYTCMYVQRHALTCSPSTCARYTECLQPVQPTARLRGELHRHLAKTASTPESIPDATPSESHRRFRSRRNGSLHVVVGGNLGELDEHIVNATWSVGERAVVSARDDADDYFEAVLACRHEDCFRGLLRGILADLFALGSFGMRVLILIGVFAGSDNHVKQRSRDSKDTTVLQGKFTMKHRGVELFLGI